MYRFKKIPVLLLSVTQCSFIKTELDVIVPILMCVLSIHLSCVWLSAFITTYFYAYFQKERNQRKNTKKKDRKKRSPSIVKIFYTWLRWKNWCIDKSKMQQRAIETDLSNKSGPTCTWKFPIQRDGNIRSVWSDKDTVMFLKRAQMQDFHHVFRRLTFWPESSHCLLLLQWFNGIISPWAIS